MPIYESTDVVRSVVCVVMRILHPTDSPKPFLVTETVNLEVLIELMNSTIDHLLQAIENKYADSFINYRRHGLSDTGGKYCKSCFSKYDTFGDLVQSP